MDEERIAFTAASPLDCLDSQFASHPPSVAGRAVLEPRGERDTLHERMLAIVAAADEDPDAFGVISCLRRRDGPSTRRTVE